MTDHDAPQHARVGAAIAFAVLLGVIFSLPLLFADAHGLDGARVYRNAASIWVNVFVIGYVQGWPFGAQIVADLARAAPVLSLSQADIDAALRRAWTGPGVWAARALGVAFGAALAADEAAALVTRQHGAWLSAWVLVLVPLLWAVILPALWRLLRVTAFIYALARDHARIHLSDLAPLGVFADIGIRHLLLIVLGLSVIPMQAIVAGSLQPEDFVPALAVTMPVALVVATLPIWGAHRAIVAAKHRETARLGALLDEAAPDSDRYLLLALYRHQVTATNEWPIAAGSAYRIVLYVVIPPLAWAGAALAQDLVASVLSWH